MKKKLLFILVTIPAATHIIFTILYLSPKNPLTPTYQAVVHRYMNPLFAQNWQLFAPNPATSSLQYWYRCKSHTRWSSWKDPMAKILREHKESYLTYRGKLTYVIQSLARSTLNEYVNLKTQCQNKPMCSQSALETKLLSNKNHQLLRRLSKELCSKVDDSQKVQFQIVKSFTKNFSQKNKNQFGKIEILKFKPFSI